MPRSNKYAKGLEQVIFFGLQAFIKKLHNEFQEGFFNKSKEEVVQEYKDFADACLGVDFDVEHVAALHDLGYLPLEFKALPEGTRVDIQRPMLSVVNTKPEFFWLTNYIETYLSASLWHPMVVASMADEYRRMFEYMADKTGADTDFIQWQGHDFSFRGMTSAESAKMSGMGHLLSFSGTDTVPSIIGVKEFL